VSSEAGRDMADRRLRWGILGAARIARKALIPAIRASSNGVLAAVASRDAERARSLARESGAVRWHGSYGALLDDPEVDAVYVPLPNALHRPWAMSAAVAGKHVLCEKPMALDAAECREMEAVAAAHGVKLMEAFMYRFHPRIEGLRELVRSGRIGEVRTVRSAFTFHLTRPGDVRLDAALGGGALMDVGCYCVNVSRLVMGAEPVEAQSRATWTPGGVDAELTGLLRFASGALAHFDCALTLERRELCEVAGTDGWLALPSTFVPGNAEATIHEHRGDEQRVHAFPGVDPYRIMVERFAESVLEDAPVPCPAEDAAHNMRAIEALYRSARAGGAPQAVEP
jgi:D-xylose 1-dehydrogenase (NADP+, D-xylono-1,5-lactone-forming)